MNRLPARLRSRRALSVRPLVPALMGLTAVTLSPAVHADGYLYTQTFTDNFSNVGGLVIDSSGDLFVADTGHHRIVERTSAGVYSSFGSKGSGVGSFLFPSAVTVDSSGNVFVADTANSRIREIDLLSCRGHREACRMHEETVTYTEIHCAQKFCFVTGIRREAGEGAPVVLTGTAGESEQTLGAVLYSGPLLATGHYDFVSLTPTFPGLTITSSAFYGPNTSLFDPRLGTGNIRAVGSYRCSESERPECDHGMMYLGGPDGAGVWTQIDVPEEAAGAEVANTVAHSIMGDLVVGNYDLVGDPVSAHAFLYNIRTDTYTVLGIGQLTTAYGIWQNDAPRSDPDTACYTITGGYDGAYRHGIDQGFLLDYYVATGPVLPPRAFGCANVPGSVTHFEAITAVAAGYSLAAMTDQGAAFVRVPRYADGSFGEAEWTPIAAPFGDGFCTGSTVLENHLLGFCQPDEGGIRSFIATVAESTQA